MSFRNQKGNTFGLVAVSTLTIVTVALGFFYILMILGGHLELSNATDSGSLAVAKNVVRIGVDLNGSVSQTARDNFAQVLDSNNKIDLVTYNRCVGQAFLVTMNAAADNGGIFKNPANPNLPMGQRNAQVLMAALKDGGGPLNIPSSQAIGNQLYDRLIEADKVEQPFDTAKFGSLRMLGGAAQTVQKDLSEFKVSYVTKDDPTNVYLDQDIFNGLNDPKVVDFPLPIPGNAVANDSNGPIKDPRSNQPYLAGYTTQPITVSGFPNGQPIKTRGVPTQPNYQPHILSLSTATANLVPLERIPPNAFISAGTAIEDRTKGRVKTRSAALVGTMDRTFAASLPGGYIEIINPPGYPSSTTMPSTANIWNNELYNGIYLATDGNQVIAFTTDQSALQRVINYNNNPVGNPPAVADSSGVPYFYNRNGAPVTNYSDVSHITQSGGAGIPQVATCNNTSANGIGNPVCQSLVGAFLIAYQNNAQPVAVRQIQEMAVEAYNDNLIQAYAVSWRSGGLPVVVNAVQWTVLTNQGGIFDGPHFKPQLPYTWGLPFQNGGDLPYAGNWVTGLRAFDHGAIIPVPQPQGTTAGPYAISHTDTVSNYLKQIVTRRGPNGAAIENAFDLVFPKLLQRCREILPGTTSDTVRTLLDNGPKLDLGQTGFIYLSGGHLVFSITAPPTLVHNAQGLPQDDHSTGVDLPIPDGNLKSFPSTEYPGIPQFINVSDPTNGGHAELGLHDAMFMVNPPLPSGICQDFAFWLPSSGFNNNLGRLIFGQTCLNNGNFPHGNFTTPN